LILHQRVRYKERGPAVTKQSKQALREWSGNSEPSATGSN
jgi:hypothetical protein